MNLVTYAHTAEEYFDMLFTTAYNMECLIDADNKTHVSTLNFIKKQILDELDDIPCKKVKDRNTQDSTYVKTIYKFTYTPDGKLQSKDRGHWILLPPYSIGKKKRRQTTKPKKISSCLPKSTGLWARNRWDAYPQAYCMTHPTYKEQKGTLASQFTALLSLAHDPMSFYDCPVIYGGYNYIYIRVKKVMYPGSREFNNTSDHIAYIPDHEKENILDRARIYNARQDKDSDDMYYLRRDIDECAIETSIQCEFQHEFHCNTYNFDPAKMLSLFKYHDFANKILNNMFDENISESELEHVNDLFRRCESKYVYTHENIYEFYQNHIDDIERFFHDISTLAKQAYVWLYNLNVEIGNLPDADEYRRYLTLNNEYIPDIHESKFAEIFEQFHTELKQ